MAGYDSEEEIFKKISTSQKRTGPSLITKLSQGERQVAVVQRVEAQEAQQAQVAQEKSRVAPFKEQLPIENFEAQILAKFDQLLLSNVSKIQKVLTSIETKVNTLEPRVQLKINSTQIFNKIEKSINDSLNKSISGIKSGLTMSIDHYNQELHERQKHFNKEHEEAAKAAIDNHRGVLEIKEKTSTVDYKRLDERIKQLMKSENRCEEFLSKIEKELLKITDSVATRNQNLAEQNKPSSSSELMEVSEEELLEMILENYEISQEDPSLMQYISSQVGIEIKRKK